MGRVSGYDLYVAPAVRDADLCVPFVCGWLAVQLVVAKLWRWLSPTYRSKLTTKQRQELVIRSVSIINGLLMTRSAIIFVRNLQAQGWAFHEDQYREIPGYRPYRILIVSYFVWDLVVCVWYNWGPMWVIHAIASLAGTYFLSFPFSDQYGCYYSGMFELSNAFLHASCILRTLQTSTITARLATLLEYVFALLFFLVRVVGGTLVTGSWLLSVTTLLQRSRTDPSAIHGEVPVIVSCALVSIIMLLQYIWFAEIVKIALGWSASPQPPPPTAAVGGKSRGSSAGKRHARKEQ